MTILDGDVDPDGELAQAESPGTAGGERPAGTLPSADDPRRFVVRPGGCWLRFRRDATVTYVETLPRDEAEASCAHFSAGTVVRVVDSQTSETWVGATTNTVRAAGGVLLGIGPGDVEELNVWPDAQGPPAYVDPLDPHGYLARLGGWPGERWFRFRRDDRVHYMVDWTHVGYADFRAGAVVRIVDSAEPDIRDWSGSPFGDWSGPSFRAADIVSFPLGEEVEELAPPEAWRIVLGRVPDEEAFWAAMAAAPADDLPRLVYADWLDERGCPAAGLLRDGRPFVLHYWVYEGGRWERQNRRPATWGQTAAELRAIAAGEHVVRAQALPRSKRLRVVCAVSLARPRPGGEAVEYRCLGVTLASGEPAPPLANYLLLRLSGAAFRAGAPASPAGDGALSPPPGI